MGSIFGDCVSERDLLFQSRTGVARGPASQTGIRGLLRLSAVGVLRPDAFADTGRSALSQSDRFAQDDNIAHTLR